MTEARTPIETLARAINEEDPDTRREVLARVWADDATLTIDGDVVATDRAGLDRFIAAWLEDSKAWLEVARDRREQDREIARWRVTGRRVRPTTFDLVGTLDADVLTALTATRGVGRASDRSAFGRLGESLVSNPFAAAGLIGGAFYLALRVPVGLFYGQLGVSPDEVGFGPQVLVPQSLTLAVVFFLCMTFLLSYLAISWPAVKLVLAHDMFEDDDDRLPRASQLLLFSAWTLPALAIALSGILLFEDDGKVPPSLGLGTAAAAILAAAIGARIGAYRIHRRHPIAGRLSDRLTVRLRRGTTTRELVVGIAGAVACYGGLLLAALPVWSLIDARRLEHGAAAGGRITPWRAQPVSLHWTKKEHVALTNDCKVLRLLGTGNGQLVLYDTKLDKLFRVPVADASAAVDRDCS